MSKVVTFDIDGLGKKTELIDTMANVQKVSKGLRRVYEAIDKVDDEKGDDAIMLDYSVALNPVLITNVKELLGLNEKEAKKLEDVSYSDLEEAYGEACKEFVGLEMPTVHMMLSNLQNFQEQQEAGEESEEPKADPKSSEDN